MKLRAWHLFVVSTILLPAAPVQAAKWEAIERVPGVTPLTLSVQGKPRVYFRVTSQLPLSLTVEGPGRLRIVSRAELPRGAARVASYRVRIDEKGKTLKEQATESSGADGVSLGGGDALLCKSRSFAVDVPAGSHRVSVSVIDVSSALVRLFLSGPSRSGAAMVSITPVEAARSVTVSEGEKLIPYYSVLPGKPVRLRIVGPTSLELSSRLDFDATMRGVQSYRLAITGEGRRLREVEFKTTKATTATYTDLKDRSASKMDRVVIPLGNGTHELAVELIEPRNGSAEIHVRIPQPTIGSEE